MLVNGNLRLRKHKTGRVWCLRPVIPALWEAKAGRSPEGIETSLTNMVKHKIIKIRWAWWWHAPVIPATQEAETGESLEPGRQRL